MELRNLWRRSLLRQLLDRPFESLARFLPNSEGERYIKGGNREHAPPLQLNDLELFYGIDDIDFPNVRVYRTPGIPRL